MDNGQTSDGSKMDGSVVLHVHGNESVRSPDDILVRRLKNRERQRRYRARKRHEADLKKASVTDQPISSEFVSVPVEVEVFETRPSTDYVTRIHCQRDWKKDARTAHMLKKQEAGPVVCSNSNAAASGGSSATFLESVAKSDILFNHSNTSNLDINMTHRSLSNRRHWKAEARNKRSSQ